MKMSKPGLCCDRCFGMIARQDTRAARLWLDLCTVHNPSSVFGLVIKEDHSLRLLETLGFITTTETPLMLIVKVHHFHPDDEDSYFCGEKCNE